MLKYTIKYVIIGYIFHLLYALQTLFVVWCEYITRYSGNDEKTIGFYIIRLVYVERGNTHEISYTFRF